ncbi:Inosine-uridine preferring nucleoside hydrolase [Musa troglodytarum]|uniref:Inosine-uridine preferring nucleoside hydrolase n=1 Tax=Musa troglodytarum TaxID=320322 RepID=A0A9E7FU41_9LILI|nr:Inosine-uridine preferring nucleoside hydrolase [Musa troglodytarum]
MLEWDEGYGLGKDTETISHLVHYYHYLKPWLHDGTNGQSIPQGLSTAGDCRCRQAIPVGVCGRLDINSNYGLRRSFLPQGERRYIPLQQPTAQRVMIDTVSAGRTTLFVIGSHTNVALFLMTNPHLKTNIEHIYSMGGGVRSKNPTGCCPPDAANPSCKPRQCGDRGNLFTAYTSNPYAEFNMFADPFAAYQVRHSGIPVTLVPLDVTNSIPVSKEFFDAFEQQQETFEAQYCFRSLELTRDTWFGDQFYTSYFMWDSFLSGVAISIMQHGDSYLGENEFAEMEYLNITAVTSNEPYGVNDGSNPFLYGRAIPKFHLQKAGVHSGYVQTGPQDPFCFVKGGGKGKCQVLNLHRQSGRFNLTTQFPYYREILYKPNFANQTRGRPVIFDMDMSAGDFLALIYLLKAPLEKIDLKGILVSGNGWAIAATIDVVYDILHMMGRDDIPVGLGHVNALGTPTLGCKYVKAVPHGSGGLLDSDTLFGLARSLPRSPRRHTAEKSAVQFGAPRHGDRRALRQASALEVWQSISESLRPRHGKITVLTSGPLTNLASILDVDKSGIEVIKNVYVVGGQVIDRKDKAGNVFSVPANKFAEFNMFLDPLAAKMAMESNLTITLVPLNAQLKVISFKRILQTLQLAEKTPESTFAHQLLSLLYQLQRKQPKLYHHMEIFLGELLGAVFLVDHSKLNPVMQRKLIRVLTGNLSQDGQIIVDKCGKSVNILDSFDSEAYYSVFAELLGDRRQSAVIGSFDEQKKMWSKPQ